jgi:hypothetical protein
VTVELHIPFTTPKWIVAKNIQSTLWSWVFDALGALFDFVWSRIAGSLASVYNAIVGSVEWCYAQIVLYLPKFITITLTTIAWYEAITRPDVPFTRKIMSFATAPILSFLAGTILQAVIPSSIHLPRWMVPINVNVFETGAGVISVSTQLLPMVVESETLTGGGFLYSGYALVPH